MASRGKSWLHINRMKMCFRDAFAHPLSQKLTVKSFLLCTCYMALHNNVFFWALHAWLVGHQDTILSLQTRSLSVCLQSDVSQVPVAATVLQSYPFSFFSPISTLLSHVLQRAVWQVRYASAVRLLSLMGPELGVQEEGHHAGDSQLQCWHHQSSGL